MSDFVPGLEGVIAFETEIAEPDKEGSALRYRGVDIEDLVGRVTFGQVWGLLVDNEFNPGLPPAEPYPIPVHSGNVRVDMQSAIAMLAPAWGLQPLLDIDDDQARDDLARVSVMAMSFAAQAARGVGRADGAHAAHRPGSDGRRADDDPLARRARPGAHPRGRRLLRLRRRARDERLHVHLARDRLDRRGRRRGDLRGHRRHVRAAARRCAQSRAAHARGGRAHRRRRGLHQGRPGPRRAADGLRPPRLPRRGSAGPRAPADLPRARMPRATRSPRPSRPPRSRSCASAAPTA